MSRKVVDIAGRRLSLSNLEKDLYPSYGFTKAHVIDYYRQISEFILPHVQNRALTLKRYPEGAEKEFFFEKRCPSHRPDWTKTTVVGGEEGERMTACMVNDLETLIWVANLASLELHVPLATAASPETPDSMVFDLDPGDGADVLDCARVAFILRDLLSDIDLTGYVKTSGKKGLHVYVPLNRKGISFEDTKKFSKTVALIMQKNYPELVTAKMAGELRKNKIFINWSQNDPSKTMVSVYSLRAGKKPTVSFPLTWDDLKKFTAQKDPERFEVLPGEAVSRAEKNGDMFNDVIAKKQKLPHL